MNKVELGNLEKIDDLRLVWDNEERDFTPWLAREENIKLLSDEIGIQIKVEEKEFSVGKYYVDILAYDESSNSKIIIENQLEVSDHDHLGKLLVYGAGCDAKTIIWIVRDATEEHRKAVEWLNDHSDEDINIFLIKMELFRIDNSRLAPHFEIISKPNDWSKILKDMDSSIELTDKKLKQLEFWKGFKESCKGKNFPFSVRKAAAQNYYDLAIGVNGCNLSLSIKPDNSLSCSLWISSNKNLFNLLKEQKEEIENKLGYTLFWDYKAGSSASSISKLSDFKIDLNSNNYEEAYEWFRDSAVEFKNVFVTYLEDCLK